MITSSHHLKLSNPNCRQQTGLGILCLLRHHAGRNSAKIQQIGMISPGIADNGKPKPALKGAKIGAGSSQPPSPSIQIPIDRANINNPA